MSPTSDIIRTGLTWKREIELAIRQASLPKDRIISVIRPMTEWRPPFECPICGSFVQSQFTVDGAPVRVCLRCGIGRSENGSIVR